MKFLEDWESIQQLGPKEKVAETKRLAYKIGEAIKSDQVEWEEFELWMKILNKASYYGVNRTAFARERNLLVRKRMKQLGLDEVKIIAKVNGTAAIESGLIGMADISMADEIIQGGVETKEIEAMEEKGLCLTLETGGDGLIPVQLRIVEAKEPMLSEKEYKLVEQSTDTIEIDCPTGELGVGDLYELDRSTVRYNSQPGKYKVCGYLFNNRQGFEAYYMVAAKQE